ncbi:LOW QUALITY PROTEIN: hypothetical protein BT93_L5520 [Corymbia citriodora subsp. variegata]|uniref:Uncharacterized protein n=1 Tax=Corymbia citriodora subsp. variegata TaxID=360336 RepID=A0A8T0CW78_CORYI|nr:LOW QUALITY PROTEIN: hypothetical protein BT93_L5520 [Corymbia citriodora subsp. variegata]
MDQRRDNAREEIGEEIKSKLSKAIWHARIALIVFSKNYAESKWCMNELIEILECKEKFGNHGHLVVPIFHEVKAGHVSKLKTRSRFAQGFESLCGNEGDDGKIQEWRNALMKTKHLTGFNLRNDAGRDEGRFVDIIVKFLVERIRATRLLQFARNAIGVDLLVDEVIPLIKTDQEEDVRVIGICGGEGMGKTIAAAVICERIHCNFECFVFLDKIGEAYRNNLVGILGLQKKLLRDLIKVEGLGSYDDIQTNINYINSNIGFKKILLVLDNVTSKGQLDYFGVGERDRLCRGSRILITTRDRNLLKDLKVDDKYIVKGLDRNEALRLFCRNAFKREEPQEGYEELSRSLVHYAGGHPLSLTKLGSFLHGESKHQWHQILEKLVRNPYLDSLFWKVGPSGGQSSDAFDDGAHTGGKQIGHYGQSTINSIAIDCDQNGCLVRPLQHGGQVHDNETSLKIHNNKKTYRPYGFERGRPFDLHIIEFNGKCSSHLLSFGADFKSISHTYPFDVVGSFGGDKGTGIWDDGKHTDVREIVIGFDSAIRSISILYDEDRRPVGPFTHGTSGGGQTYTIKLDHLSDYLTSISGYIEEVSELTILRSLTIHTNRRDHGPIGTTNKGRHFSFPYTGGKIVGFHGSCNGPCLQSIGAFYKPIPHTYPVKVFGPFGGKGQQCCDFVDLKGIIVCYTNFIESIAFEVDDATSSEPETNCGGNGKDKPSHKQKVKMRKGEYITSFWGYLKNANGSGTRINSLTFQTNKRILGPIGREEGQYFSLPSELGKLSTFRGDYLESIGAQVEPYYPFQSMGPFKSMGLSESSNASSWDDGNKHYNVRKIIVEFVPSKGSRIRSITFQYEEESKELWQSETHGGIDDKKFHTVNTVHTIQIHDPNEYLTSISGYYHLHGITSLTFQTNKKTIGPIGDEEGWHFSSPATGGKIVGIYGRSGEYLEAIGAYFEPITHLYPIKSIGFGGLGGRAWNNKSFNGVREIEIMYDNGIRYIMFVYDKNGERVCSMPSGHTNVDKDKVIKREDGDGDINNDIVQSLTFHSNRRRHGPFGKEMGKYFWYPSTGSKIIGFYGTWEGTLKSMGAYAEPIPRLYPFKTTGPFGNSDGTPWDDGVHTDVRGIYMDSAGGGIYGISIRYDDNGSFVQCSRHGREADPSGYLGLTLDYPKERLVWISFLVNENGNTADTVIHNLKIHTTKTTYGPFGKAKWNKYAFGKLTEICIPSEPSGGRIVGFFGKAGSHLNSIGARLEPY